MRKIKSVSVDKLYRQFENNTKIDQSQDVIVSNAFIPVRSNLKCIHNKQLFTFTSAFVQTPCIKIHFLHRMTKYSGSDHYPLFIIKKTLNEKVQLPRSQISEFVTLQM